MTREGRLRHCSFVNDTLPSTTPILVKNSGRILQISVGAVAAIILEWPIGLAAMIFVYPMSLVFVDASGAWVLYFEEYGLGIIYMAVKIVMAYGVYNYWRKRTTQQLKVKSFLVVSILMPLLSPAFYNGVAWLIDLIRSSN